jgi:hypothetical protein
MLNLKIEDLINDLRQRRVHGEPSPAVLLGAGASVESGIETMDGLFELVGCSDFDEFVEYIEPRTPSERYRLLAGYLQTRDPVLVTAGYLALAHLCAEAYFDLVLTTNLDPLLEDALAAAKLRRRDYVVIVNGVIQTERVKPLLRTSRPRVKVVKLHGDLFYRFMAWTPQEMEDCLVDIEPRLTQVLEGRDILVLGHSLRDDRIRQLVLDAGGAIWYVTPEAVPAHLKDNRLVRAVVSDDCRFERLFPRLAGALGIAVPSVPTEVIEPAPTLVTTIDDLMAAVVGVIHLGGAPNMTGFLIEEPRVIVTDGYYGNVADLDFKDVRIVTNDGQEFHTNVVHHASDHPFGPLVLRVPGEIRAAGLRLNTSPIAADAEIQVAVAAGKRTGLAVGSVSTGLEVDLNIAPIGMVEGIMELQVVVAPGSSGAPVVDRDMAVRGFIVAGSSDPASPPSFMYPVTAWRDAIETIDIP